MYHLRLRSAAELEVSFASPFPCRSVSIMEQNEQENKAILTNMNSSTGGRFAHFWSYRNKTLQAYGFSWRRSIQQTRRERLGFDFAIAERFSRRRKQSRRNFRVISHHSNFSGTKRAVFVVAKSTPRCLNVEEISRTCSDNTTLLTFIVRHVFKSSREIPACNPASHVNFQIR